MKLYSKNNFYKLYSGNMLDMLEVIEENSIDSIVTDPPYELNFMGKGWDNSGIAFQPDTWKKCYDVLKPGGYLLAFGGSRTFHRIACAIEDAGFEIRDTIMWLYGSGFPKSHNIGLDIDKLNGCPDRGHRIAVANRHHPDGTLEPNGEKLEPYEAKTEEAKKWNGWGTALKPSFEPIIVARKPLDGTVAQNCLKWGVGGINIDECRVGNEERTIPINAEEIEIKQNGSHLDTLHKNQQHERISTNQGRFPANTILTYDETDFDEVCGGFPISETHSMGNKETAKSTGMFGVGNITNMNRISSKGSASRYFYCAKASKKDRDEGCQDLEDTVNACSNQAIAELKRGNDNFSDETNSTFNKVYKGKNTHPTVKPTELMQYLVRLVTPNNGTVLDPFNGSGSTGKAVMYENKERNKNYNYIGIELTEEYLPIAKARIEYVSKDLQVVQTTLDLSDLD